MKKDNVKVFSFDLKKIEATALVTLLLFLASVSLTSAQTVEELQAQINALLRQIAQMQGQSSMPTSDDYPSTTTTTTSGARCPNLYSTIQLGSRNQGEKDIQVEELQIFLAEYYDIARNELVTGYFGTVTRSLVIRFQQEHGLPAYGIVGTLTRAKIAEVCGGSVPGGGLSLSVVESETKNYVVNYRLYAPARYAGYHVVLILNPISPSSPISSGELITWQIATNWSGGTERGEVGVQFAHQGFATNSGGVHWFSVVPGSYKLGVAVYPASPFKPGTEMEYYSVEELYRRGLGNVDTADSASFQIVGPKEQAGITVTVPNGGERWEIGQLNTVTWAPYGYNPDVNPARDVDVYLEDLNGDRVGKVMDTGKASLHTYFNIDGYDKWAEPGQYYVSAVNNKTGAWDRSDAPFTLLPRAIDVKVNGSDGPVTLYDNQPITVTFKQGTELESCKLSGVRKAPNGEYNFPINSTDTINGYAFAPAGGGSTAIVVRCETGKREQRSDAVQVNIGSVSATLKVISPNGGEKIPLDGSLQYITWRESGLGTVDIALYMNDKWLGWINKSVTPDGKISWTPSMYKMVMDNYTAGNVFKIYITGRKADGTGYVDDKSDKPFSFVGGSTEEPALYTKFINAGTAKISGAGEPDIGTFHITFDVGAGDDDVYIDRSVSMDKERDGKGALGSGFQWMTTKGSVGVKNFSAVITAEGPSSGDSANTFKVAEGDTRRFTLTISLQPTSDGSVGVQLTGINWATSDGASASNFYTSGLEGYKTGNLTLSLNAATPPTPPPGAIIGHLDSLSSDVQGYFLTGWTCQVGVAESIGLHVYAGKSAYEKGTYTKIAGTANLTSEAAVNTRCKTPATSKHRFKVYLPASAIQTYQGQPIYVHGLRKIDGVQNSAITNSGTFKFPLPVAAPASGAGSSPVSLVVPARGEGEAYAQLANALAALEAGLQLLISKLGSI